MLVEGSVKPYLANSYGGVALEVNDQVTCGLSLIVVVNAVIAGLGAIVAFLMVGIATHFLG
jgi:hypothetical protein